MKLSVRNISKTYTNKVKALDAISFDLQAGMFGLLGPNGAGKSTLMRTIATLQQPDSGSIEFNELDIFEHRHEFRKTLGFLPQEFGVYPKESANALLEYFAILKGISSKKDRTFIIDKVLEITNLHDARNQRVSTFSGGMRQRFGIAQLLLNNPQLIIVDEPTAGLDPAERSRFLNVLRNIGTDNIVIFSTHLVEDVRELCRDMAIINKGKLLIQNDPKQAVRSLEGKVYECMLTEDQLRTTGLQYQKLSDSYDDDGNLIQRIYSLEDHAEFKPAQAKLEDHYFHTLKTS